MTMSPGVAAAWSRTSCSPPAWPSGLGAERARRGAMPDEPRWQAAARSPPRQPRGHDGVFQLHRLRARQLAHIPGPRVRRVAVRAPHIDRRGGARPKTANLDGPALYLRWQLAGSHDLSIQAGRIPPVIGAFPRRAYGHDNAVIGEPLVYQYLTSCVRTPSRDRLRLAAHARPRMAADLPIGLGDGPWRAPGCRRRVGTGVEGAGRHACRTPRPSHSGAPAVPVVQRDEAGVTWSSRAAAHPSRRAHVGVSGPRGVTGSKMASST